jgi:hypothetical protein
MPSLPVTAAGEDRFRALERALTLWTRQLHPDPCGAELPERIPRCVQEAVVGGAYRTEIGLCETGAGHGLLLRDRLGGIWEVASGANRPEPVPTELK